MRAYLSPFNSSGPVFPLPSLGNKFYTRMTAKPSLSDQDLVKHLCDTFLNANSTTNSVSLKLWYEDSKLKFFLTNNPPPSPPCHHSPPENRVPSQRSLVTSTPDPPPTPSVPVPPPPNTRNKRRKRQISAKSLEGETLREGEEENSFKNISFCEEE